MVEDQLSGLPNKILYSIFHVLPVKDVVCINCISTLYKMMWLEVLVASPILDFTNRDIVGDSDQTIVRATTMVCVSWFEGRGEMSEGADTIFEVFGLGASWDESANKTEHSSYSRAAASL
jgi:hypothetical protein